MLSVILLRRRPVWRVSPSSQGAGWGKNTSSCPDRTVQLVNFAGPRGKEFFYSMKFLNIWTAVSVRHVVGELYLVGWEVRWGEVISVYDICWQLASSQFLDDHWPWDEMTGFNYIKQVTESPPAFTSTRNKRLTTTHWHDLMTRRSFRSALVY